MLARTSSSCPFLGELILIVHEIGIDFYITELFICCSGTTGLPKGVMLTHFNVGSNIQQLRVPGTLHLKQSANGNPPTD